MKKLFKDFQKKQLPRSFFQRLGANIFGTFTICSIEIILYTISKKSKRSKFGNQNEILPETFSKLCIQRTHSFIDNNS